MVNIEIFPVLVYEDMEGEKFGLGHMVRLVAGFRKVEEAEEYIEYKTSKDGRKYYFRVLRGEEEV